MMLRTKRSRPIHAVALAALATLGLAAAPQPVAAQDLVYTLRGVTFNDGATATGSVTYNPSTQTFRDYDVTTTNGLKDKLTGAEYAPKNQSQVALLGVSGFQFTTGPTSSSNLRDSNQLALNFYPFPTSPGVYRLNPGNVVPPTQFQDSGELAPIKRGPRVITAGEIVVTALSAPSNHGTAAPPVMSVTGAARERGGFLVSRVAGSPDVDVVVNYHVGGSALGGNDYETFSGQVLLPAGQTEAVIPVRLLPGANLGRKTRVILDPSPSGDYDIEKGQSKVILSDLS